MKNKLFIVLFLFLLLMALVACNDTSKIVYNLSSNVEGDGEIILNKLNAFAGDIITVTIKIGTYSKYVEDSLAYNGTPIKGNSFIMPQENVLVTARFEPIPLYTLSVTAQAGGKVNTQGSNYRANEKIPLNAIPNDKFSFGGWYEGEVLLSKSPSFTYIMPNRNTTVTATFIPFPQYSLTVTSDEGGNVSSNGGLYYENDSITLTAYAFTDYIFYGWFDDAGNLVSNNPVYTFNMPSHKVILVARFVSTTIPTYSLTVTGTLCLVSHVAKMYNEGAQIELTAVPDENCHFIGWYELIGSEQTLLSKQSTFTFTMPAKATTLLAVCDKNPTYTLSVSSTNGGSINIFEADLYAGDTQLLIARPDTDFDFLGWYENDKLLTQELEFTFTMPNHDVSIEARFENTYILIYNANGLISVATDMTAKYRLMADISLSAPFTPLGTTPDGITPFTGIFDGNGHTITTTLSPVVYGTYTYCGLFGKVAKSGSIAKLYTVLSANIKLLTNNLYIGVVCDNSGTLSQIKSQGSVVAENERATIIVGGICGYNNGGDISQCVSLLSISVNAGNPHVGGIVGDNSGTISDCRSQAVLSAQALYNGTAIVGGIVGEHWGKIIRCLSLSALSLDGATCYGGCICGNSIGSFNKTLSGGSITAQGQALFIGTVTGNDHQNKSTFNLCRYAENTSFYLNFLHSIKTEPTLINGESVALNSLNNSRFYTHTLLWSDEIWQFSSLDAQDNKYPVLKFEI